MIVDFHTMSLIYILKGLTMMIFVVANMKLFFAFTAKPFVRKNGRNISYSLCNIVLILFFFCLFKSISYYYDSYKSLKIDKMQEYAYRGIVIGDKLIVP